MLNELPQPIANSTKKGATFVHWLIAIPFTAALGIEIAFYCFHISFLGRFDSVLVLLAAASTLAGMWRRLPLQNIFLAALGVAIIGGGFSALGAKTGLPFGPFLYTSQMEPLLFNTLPWAMPIIWIIIVLASRGVARLILRPWRKTKNYGFRNIGLTALLVVLFDVAFEPYVFQVKHYWLWSPTKLPVSWEGVPLINFLAWGLVATLILFFIAPVLIVKKPRSKMGPDLHPLGVWVGCVVLFGAGCAATGIWLAVIADVAIIIGTMAFAIRGAFW